MTTVKAGQTIWVTSYHVFESCGGFWWRPDRDTALMDYTAECISWAEIEIPTRIRLVQIIVPEEALHCDETVYTGDGPQRMTCSYDDPVTCWLDANLACLEESWPAEKVRLILPK